MTKRKNNEPAAARGTVVGLFHNQADAERAIERLKEYGFSEDQIGVALRDRERQQQLADDTGTQAAEGAAAGAVGGQRCQAGCARRRRADELGLKGAAWREARIPA